VTALQSRVAVLEVREGKAAADQLVAELESQIAKAFEDNGVPARD
jgi:hypothetical protein